RLPGSSSRSASGRAGDRVPMPPCADTPAIPRTTRFFFVSLGPVGKGAFAFSCSLRSSRTTTVRWKQRPRSWSPGMLSLPPPSSRGLANEPVLRCPSYPPPLRESSIYGSPSRPAFLFDEIFQPTPSWPERLTECLTLSSYRRRIDRRPYP